MSTWSWSFSAALGLAALLFCAAPLWANEAGEGHEHPVDEVDLFLEDFHAIPRQDPFRPLMKVKPLPKPRVAAEVDDAPAPAPVRPKQIVFNGQAPVEGSGYERMPRIKITGLLQVRGRMAACGLVEDEASVLHPGDTIVLQGESANENRARHFTVVAIDAGGMTIVLDDGHQIRGKFH